MTDRGLMLVLSSPSGAGKSTLARALLQDDARFVPSVSCTTRGRRPSEADGVHYSFVSPARFDEIRTSGGFLEWARVHGNLYGTPRASVEASLAAGRDVVFDIDWQGTQQLYDAVPRAGILSVFVLPPSAAELHARLSRRAEDSEETILRRLSNARDEIRRWRAYDHVLVNTDFDTTFGALRSLVGAARAGARPPKTGLDHAAARDLVDDLDAGLTAIVEGESLELGRPAA